jgi:21S rRNA (GM2251-2'-O)-methyltransferase
MLSIANARGVRGLTCFSHARLPAKRLASLTGAIQRGARKSWDVRDRTARYNSRTDSNVSTGFGGESARAPPRADPSQQDYARKRQAEPGRFPRRDSRADTEGMTSYPRGDSRADPEGMTRYPRRDSRADPEGMTRYPRRDARGSAQDGRPAENFSRRDGDSRSFPLKPRAREDSLRGGKRYRDTSRDLPAAINEVPENRESGYLGLPKEGGGLSISRRPAKEESAPRPYYRDRHRPGGLRDAADEVVPERRIAEGHPPWRDHESFSRDQSARERPWRTEARDQNQRPRFKEVPREYATQGEGGRKPYPAKYGARQTSSSEQEASATGRSWQETKPGIRRMTVPLSIPRSSAASEFIYGTSAVKAALRARARKLYKLYIYRGEGGTEDREGDKEFLKLAEQSGLDVKRLGEGEDDLRLMNKMSLGRTHNGYVLEASQLPSTPVEALDNVDGPGDGFTFTPGHQSAEDLAVNGTSSKISGKGHRYPFVLMLDSILDPGNLGAIIRSAAFFGVDAIALIDHNLAPFSPVTLKASSGAAEHMPYLKIKKDLDFVKRSQSNGWKFFAAIAPESASANRAGPNAITLRDAEDALRKGPCVLILGGEGDGLRPRLQKAADEMIGIEGAAGLNSEMGLDSLNVSVAAALMMQIFVKGSSARARSKASESEADEAKEDDLLF